MPRFGEFTIQQIPFSHFMHFSLIGGATDVLLSLIPKGSIPCNCRITSLIMAVDPAPGVGKTVSFTLSNGVDSMTVSVTGAEISDKNTTGFDLNVETQDLTLHYTETAGGASNKATILIGKRFI